MSFVRDAAFICAMYAIASALPALSAVTIIVVASITTVYEVNMETRFVAIIGAIATALTVSSVLNLA